MSDDPQRPQPIETPAKRLTLRWVLVCFPVLVLGTVGGFVLTHALSPRPSPPHVARLRHIQARLLDLRRLLQEQKVRTGSYPTNNEGLASLAFPVRFPVRCEAVAYPGARPMIVSCGTSTRQVHWPPPLVQRDGRPNVPRSADELVERGFRPGYSEARQRYPVDLELAASDADELYLVSPAGVSTGWTLPIGYENRRGLPCEVFATSPATQDRSRRYSVNVDDGVFLYSTEGELYAQAADEELRDRVLTGAIGVALLAAAYLLVRLLLCGKDRCAGITAMASAAGFGLFVHTAPTCLISCYRPADLLAGNPRPVARQRQLLARYRSRGVITDATYRKMVASLELAPSSQPASSPGASRR